MIMHIYIILINIFILTMIIMICSGILAHWETDPECIWDVVQPFTPENARKIMQPISSVHEDAFIYFSFFFPL